MFHVWQEVKCCPWLHPENSSETHFLSFWIFLIFWKCIKTKIISPPHVKMMRINLMWKFLLMASYLKCWLPNSKHSGDEPAVKWSSKNTFTSSNSYGLLQYDMSSEFTFLEFYKTFMTYHISKWIISKGSVNHLLQLPNCLTWCLTQLLKEHTMSHMYFVCYHFSENWMQNTSL